MVYGLPSAAVLLPEMETDAVENRAVTFTFCLKLVSVRLMVVTPSLHLTKI